VYSESESPVLRTGVIWKSGVRWRAYKKEEQRRKIIVREHCKHDLKTGLNR